MISNWNLLSDLERFSVKILFASLNLLAKEFPIDVKKNIKLISSFLIISSETIIRIIINIILNRNFLFWN